MIYFNDCLYLLLDRSFELGSTAKIILMIILMLGSAAIAYLLGSINSAVIISKLLYHEDIRTKGSGNAGATNMLRNYGKVAAGLTLLGDMLKCAAAVVIGALLWIDGAYIAGVFCVVGHVFPCWHGFRGGKGVAVTAMVAVLTSPIVFLILLVIFLIILIGTKYVSLASIMAALLYPVFMSSWNSIVDNEGSFNVVMAFLQTAIILVMHRENIKRLLDKTEPKISLRPGRGGSAAEEPEPRPEFDESEFAPHYVERKKKKKRKGKK